MLEQLNISIVITFPDGIVRGFDSIMCLLSHNPAWTRYTKTSSQNISDAQKHCLPEMMLYAENNVENKALECIL